MIEQSVAKKKRGFPRKSGEVSPVTVRTRNLRDRVQIQAMAENAAVAAAGAAAKALTPHGVSDEVQKLIAESAEQVSKIIAINGPAVIQALVDRAVNHSDTNAAALLTRYIVSPKTKIKLPIERGDTIESFADRIIAAATTGELALQDASQALDLIRTHGEISLSAGLTARLAKLNEQLADARARNVIPAEVRLTREPIPLETFLEMQRAKS